MAKILLVENTPNWRKLLEKAVSPPHDLNCCPSPGDMPACLRENHYDIILLTFPVTGNHDIFPLLRRAKGSAPSTRVIVISESRDPKTIVRAVREGAFDFIVKPFQREEILLSIERAMEDRGLRSEIDYLRREQDIIYDFDAIISSSPAMKRTISMLRKFSKADSTILLTGETGTGKSFLSGAVHFNSRRRKRPFVKINCANIPEGLLESELFGHEKGAFTGANRTRMGRLEQANGGTVFLDEIGEMSQGLQARLLRVLEEKSFERVGGNRTIHSDVRIICATNRDPEKQVEDGKFREDLYYRINILRVHLPPLRERVECIEPLARFLLKKCCRTIKKDIKGFEPEVLESFRNYDWPGNIRQLANTIERAVILEDGPYIRIENTVLGGHATREREADASPRSTGPHLSLKDREKETILRALEQSLWVQKDAAKLLGTSPRALNYKIRKFGISHPRWRKNR